MLGLAAAAAILNSMPWSAALDRKQFDGQRVSIVQFKEFLKPAIAKVGDNNFKAKGNWACSVAPITVLLSATPSLMEGATKTVMIWRPPGDQPMVEAHVNRATHYLMVSIPMNDSGFKITNGSIVFLTSLFLKPDKPADEMALLLLPTRAKSLPTGLTSSDLVTAAIIDSVNPADRESYSNVVRLLCLAHPNWIQGPPKYRSNGLPPILTQTCPPGPLVSRVKTAIANARDSYEKSQLWGLLVRWHVHGSVSGYFTSLRNLLDDPNVYSDGEEVSPYWGLVEGVNDETYEFDDLLIESGAENVRDLLGAQNPALAIYWMRHWGGPENDEQLRSFGTLLGWQNKRVQYEVAEILSERMHEPSHAPKLYDTVAGQEIAYPDLKEVVTYWKDRLHIR